MASYTVKGMSDKLRKDLKIFAAQEDSNMNQEILKAIETHIHPPTVHTASAAAADLSTLKTRLRLREVSAAYRSGTQWAVNEAAECRAAIKAMEDAAGAELVAPWSSYHEKYHSGTTYQRSLIAAVEAERQAARTICGSAAAAGGIDRGADRRIDAILAGPTEAPQNSVTAIQDEDDAFTDRYRIHLEGKNITFVVSTSGSRACDIADVDGYYFRDRRGGPGAMNKFFNFKTDQVTVIS